MGQFTNAGPSNPEGYEAPIFNGASFYDGNSNESIFYLCNNWYLIW